MKKLLALVPLMMLLSIVFYNCGGGEEETDPCDELNCINGGTCVDGACQCPERYTGTTCAEQITPSAIKLVKVELTRWPAKNESGQSWDSDGTGPDLSIELLYKGTAQMYEYHYQINDVYEGQSYEFIPNSTTTIDQLDDYYVINLNDKDDIGQDLMESLQFDLYDDQNGFPETITVGDESTKAVFVIHIAYIF